MHSETDWTATARQFQQSLQQGLAAQWSQWTAGAPGGTPAGSDAGQALRFDSEKLQALQSRYVQEAAQLWQSEHQAPPAGDRRFATDAWNRNPLAAFMAACYALHTRTLSALADAVETDDKTRARIRFAVEQWAAASAPSNFLAFNADAQQKAIETRGESIARGMQNLLHDLRQGHVSQTDETVFEVGRNVATTEGAVVFENELFQLIEYKPLTPKVHARPLLLVPPCINKFYILDLQPENSLIRFSVEQGMRTFVVSWRNPDVSQGHLTWDDYVEEGVIRAIATAREISQADAVNTLGFCVGGTLLGTALAVMSARHADASPKAAKAGARSRRTAPAAGGVPGVASATFLTTFLEFSETGVLDVFIDEPSVRYREMQFANGGLLPGRELASTFSFLRPNDLVWNYVVGNYLKGETPPPFDLLYWNGDATNLPGPFYAWYLRNTYLENNLAQPGKLQVCGVPVDMGRVDLPVYLYGSREDHIVPIGTQGGGAYASTRILPGPKRFVMGASGHIAGVINPPAKKKRSYWVRGDETLPAAFGEWLDGATEYPGSWWTDWAQWLQTHAGPLAAAPQAYGDAAHPAIEPAPGRYVKARA